MCYYVDVLYDERQTNKILCFSESCGDKKVLFLTIKVFELLLLIAFQDIMVASGATTFLVFISFNVIRKVYWKATAS